jgi:hypothetical protein
VDAVSDLRFDGVVDAWGDQPDGAERLTIGGRWVVSEINESFPFNTAVTVAIADERFTGALDADVGMRGYSEWTPGEPSQLTVGPHSILDVLQRYDGQTVTMWVADEPVDLADGEETP